MTSHLQSARRHMGDLKLAERGFYSLMTTTELLAIGINNVLFGVK